MRVHIVLTVLTLSTSAAAQIEMPSNHGPGSFSGDRTTVQNSLVSLNQGALSLNAPMVAPTSRGVPPVSVFPRYSSQGRLTEFGMGWSNEIALYPQFPDGIPGGTFNTLTGIFGLLRAGNDSAFYSPTMSPAVRVQVQTTMHRALAHMPDGSTWTFGFAVAGACAPPTLCDVAWHLTRVESVTGEVAVIEYDSPWSFGRPFISRVRYGGRGEDFQHELVFEHTTHDVIPQLNYAFGRDTGIDRRVSVIVARTKNQAGQFEEVWRYLLHYDYSDAGRGNFLREIVRRFPSGAQEPPVTYTYEKLDDELDQPGVAVAGSSGGLAGTTLTSIVDLNRDGLPDYFQLKGAPFQALSPNYVIEPGPAQTSVPLSHPCRLREGVTLAFLHPEDTDVAAIQYDVGYLPQGGGEVTLATFCTRAQEIIPGGIVLEPSWPVSSARYTKITDIDERDGRPDFIYFHHYGIEIYRNVSPAPGLYEFVHTESQDIVPPFDDAPAFVDDFNGDGVTDIAFRDNDNGLVYVWYRMGLRDVLGYSPAVLQVLELPVGTKLTFADVDRDGMVDALIPRPEHWDFHANTGNGFATARPIAHCSGTNKCALTYSFPYALELRCDPTGAPSQTFAWAFTQGTSAGLLTGVDDGRGNRDEYHYERHPTKAASGQAPIVMTRLTRRSEPSAITTVTDYAYEGLRSHSGSGQFLGFEKVTATTEKSVESIEFETGDDFAGLMRRVDSKQLGPLARHHRTEITYGAPLYRYVRYKRAEIVRSSLIDASGASVQSQETRYMNHEREVCPGRVETERAEGIIANNYEYFTPFPDWQNPFHCMATKEWGFTFHFAGEFDSRWSRTWSRTNLGLVAESRDERPADGESYLRQSISYNPDHTVAAVTDTQFGTTEYHYEPGTRLLHSVTQPDGVTSEIVARHGATDLPTDIAINRGATPYHLYYAFDDRWRLEKTWSSLAPTSSAAEPVNEYTFQDGTPLAPSMLQVATRISWPSSGSASTRTGATLLGSQGNVITAADHAANGTWNFGRFARPIDAYAMQIDAAPWPSLSQHPSTLSYADLAVASQTLGTVSVSASGETEASQFTQGTGSPAISQSVFRDSPTSVLATAADGSAVSALTNFLGLPVRTTDQVNRQQYYDYDLLGRLRRVHYADGSIAETSYDDLGRITQAHRSDIGTIAWSYVEGATLPFHVARWNGYSDRLVSYIEYDSIGRVSFVDKMPNDWSQPRRTEYVYDGHMGKGRPFVPGELGQLTAVINDDVTKLFTHLPDGRQLCATWEVSRIGSVESCTSYFEGGVPQGELTTQRDRFGNVLSQSIKTIELDSAGNPSNLTIGGFSASFTYDAYGDLQEVQFPVAGSLHFSYDSLTRDVDTVTRSTANGPLAVRATYNSRGLVAQEQIQQGSSSWNRSYGYTPDGSLSWASENDHYWNYAYDSTGRRIEDQIDGSPVSIDHYEGPPSEIWHGSNYYRFDEYGRVAQKNDIYFNYREDGEVGDASGAGVQSSYGYDESGQRIFEERRHYDGSVTKRGFTPFGIMTEDGLVQPTYVAGQLFGLLLPDGSFQRMVTDIRGSAISEIGPLNVPAPFGTRWFGQPDEELVSYLGFGYDPYFGLIRMGVRDYDPDLGQFLSPDWLYIANPELSVGDHQAADLFAYAHNDPINFMDPTGYQTVVITTGPGGSGGGGGGSAPPQPAPTPLGEGANYCALFICWQVPYNQPSPSSPWNPTPPQSGQIIRAGPTQGAPQASITPKQTYARPGAAAAPHNYAENLAAHPVDNAAALAIAGIQSVNAGLEAVGLDEKNLLTLQMGSLWTPTPFDDIAVASAMGVRLAARGAGRLVPIAEAAYNYGAVRTVAGYQLGGTAGLVGKTYNVNLWGLYATESSQGLRALGSALRAEAAAAGATEISITGSAVINQGLLNISPAAAARFGFEFTRISETTILLRGLVP